MKREDKVPGFWRQSFEDYRDQIGHEVSLNEFVRAMISSGEWEPDHEDEVRIAMKQAGAALRSSEDQDGNRLILCVKNHQGEMWDSRHKADWNFRQNFLNEQAQRTVDLMNKTKRLHAVMNAERNKGEPKFQLRFDFDKKREADAG